MGRGKKDELTADSVVRRSKRVPWRTIEGKGILVDRDSGYYFSMNRTGQFIWSEIDGVRSIQEIAARVVERFEVDDVTALRDCLDLMGDLMEQGLVVPVTP
jgi:hypothetical protein